MTRIVIGLGRRTALTPDEVIRVLEPHFFRREIKVIQTTLPGGTKSTAEKVEDFVELLYERDGSADLYIGMDRQHDDEDGQEVAAMIVQGRRETYCINPADTPLLEGLRKVVCYECLGPSVERCTKKSIPH